MSDYPASNTCHCCGVWCNYELVPVCPTSDGALCGNCAGLHGYDEPANLDELNGEPT